MDFVNYKMIMCQNSSAKPKRFLKKKQKTLNFSAGRWIFVNDKMILGINAKINLGRRIININYSLTLKILGLFKQGGIMQKPLLI